MEHHGGSQNHSTLIRYGAITSARIADGQWWRTVTAIFLHIGARHLIGNLATLLVLGVITLRLWGPGRVLFLYVVSGILGNWAGFFFGSSVALKAGASGAMPRTSSSRPLGISGQLPIRARSARGAPPWARNLTMDCAPRTRQ